MTSIVFAPRREDPLSDVEPIISGGWALFRPSVTVEGAQWVFDEWSVKVMLDGTSKNLLLDPNDTVPYEMLLDIPDGMGGRKKVTEFRFVKTSTVGGTAWQALEKVTGPLGGSLPTNTQAAINTALWAAINNVSGGATNLAGITNMSADARSLLVSPNTYATMRGLLGAAASSHTHVATTDLTATGTKNATTFLRGDNTWAVPPASGGSTSAAWADITGKPSTYPADLSTIQGQVDALTAALAATPYLWFPSGGVFPGRPATGRSVWFMSSTITPTTNGSTSGGGGMVLGLDVLVKALP